MDPALSFQDVIPQGSRSIRKIPVPPNRRPFAPKEPLREGSPQEPPKGRGRARRFGLWTLASLLLVTLLFMIFSLVFAGARVVIVPRHVSLPVEQTLFATKGLAGEGVPFEVVSSSGEESLIVPARGEQHVERRASGTIVIYNNYSKASQRLIKNTRFETNEGLIFRIGESVVVPGQRTDGGGAVPGSIEVAVHADSAGEEYNIGISDFTIPGFKGDPRYGAFYARSKTPMAGGFVGEERIVSSEDLEKARATLQESLRAHLAEGARATLPPGYLLYDDLIFLDFISLPTLGEGSENAKVTEKGVLRAFILPEAALAGALARGVPPYEALALTIPNAKDLSVTLSGKSAVDPENVSAITLSLTGDAFLVARLDEEAFKNELRALPKAALADVQATHPEIETLKLILTPFWKSALPEKNEDIDIVIETPQPASS